MLFHSQSIRDKRAGGAILLLVKHQAAMNQFDSAAASDFLDLVDGEEIACEEVIGEKAVWKKAYPTALVQLGPHGHAAQVHKLPLVWFSSTIMQALRR